MAVDARAGQGMATHPVVGLDRGGRGPPAAGQGNEYRTPTSRTYWEIARDNSYPLINGPLLLVSIVLVSFGAYVEAALTGLPVLGNIAIGVVQGSRAKRQLDRVALLSQPTSLVVRDGIEHQVHPSELVLGRHRRRRSGGRDPARRAGRRRDAGLDRRVGTHRRVRPDREGVR